MQELPDCTPATALRGTTPHEAALYYASLGWRVLPVHSPRGSSCSCGNCRCPHPAKHPRISDWRNQASSDPDKIREWWTTWPGANIGVLTGRESDIVVLDVDGQIGRESLDLLQAENGRLPATPAVHRGLNQHLYFAYPQESSVASRIRFLPGLDLLSDGRFVVAPFSVHKTGDEYLWEFSSDPDQVSLSPLPDFLMRLGSLEQSKTRVDSDRSKLVRFREGERNNAMAQIAGAMRRQGAPEEAIRVALEVTNEKSCIPPLDEKEVHKVSASIARYEPQVVSVNGDAPRRIEYIDLEMARRNGIPPMNWILQGWLAVEDIALLAGPAGAGKTTVGLDLAVAVATERPWCGITPSRPMHVLVFDEEQDVGTTTRLVLRLLDKDRSKNLHVASGCGLRLDDAESLALLEAEIASLRPGLLLIDSAQQSFGATDENSATAVGQVFRQLMHFRNQYGVTILIIHHTAKANEMKRSGIDLPRGSTAFATQSSTVWVAGTDQGTLVLTQVKRRGAPKLTMRVAYEEESEDGAIRLTRSQEVHVEKKKPRDQAMEWILSFLKDKGEARTSEILEAAEASGHSRSTIQRVLKEQEVLKAGWGLYRHPDFAKAR